MTILSSIPQSNLAPTFYDECKGSLSIIEPYATENLCINPSFEIDTYNWVVTPNLRTDLDSWSGGYSLVSNGSALYGNSVPLILTQLKMYAISFYFKSTRIDSPEELTVTLIDATAVVRSTWKYKAKPNEWQRFVGVAYIGTSSASWTFNIASLDTIYIDAVQVELVDKNTDGATTYFDGTFDGFINESQVPLPQYSWKGYPHTSVSVRSVNAGNGGRIIDLYKKFGYQLIAVSGADNPNQDNQVIYYKGSDGASLQDIVIPARTITFIGKLYASSKNELHKKITDFQSYFSRDKNAYRQQKTFIFQNTNQSENVGQPLTFYGVVENTMQIMMANQLEATINLQIKMLNPFFYGHDESVLFSNSATRNAETGIYYAPDYTTQNWDFTISPLFTFQYLKLGIRVNGRVRCILEAYDGTIFFGGNFTQLFNSVTPVFNCNYFAKYNPSTGVISGTGTTPATTFNNAVWDMEMSLDKRFIYIVGQFTSVNGSTCNRITMYDIVNNTFSTIGGGVGGGVNNDVYTITRRDTILGITGGGESQYNLFIGGSFTATTTATNTYRIAAVNTNTNLITAIGTNSGMNDIVYKLVYNQNQERLYIGGQFTTSQGGAANAFPRIAYINFITAPTTTVAFYTGFNDIVYALYTDPVTNDLYVGGQFTATSAGASILRIASYNGAIFNQLDTGIATSISLGSTIVYDIVPYKNGLLIVGLFDAFTVGSFTDRRYSAVWYNGQSLYGVPYGYYTGIYTAFASMDSTLYIGPFFSTTSDLYMNANLKAVNNTSTAISNMKYVLISGNSTSQNFIIYRFTNETSQVQMDIRTLQMNPRDIVTINTSTGNITSIQRGDLSSYLVNSSGVNTLKVLPGLNFLTCTYLAQTTVQPFYVLCIWKQTFNNLFDGINIK